ncbi:MAG: porin family protein [Candidatus Sungbacteria bacterium]|uniref:Porin family protein n=1 Tax=Candidatus Sungiibacteriota bacterium TaxID=2750080 RepID=A0A932QXP2_9BACT|nr:porin family protein [Candidatus Sungbacteria bacterium]
MKHIVKTTFLGTCLLALAAGSAQSANQPAQSQSPQTWSSWYGSVSGDATWFHSHTGGGGNADLGTELFANRIGDVRLEGEVGYHDLPSSHYWTYMGNLYFDFNGFSTEPGNRIVPYVGAGIGDADIHLHDASDNVFAYQFMAGISFVPDSTPNTAWSLGYRYLDSSAVEGHDLLGLGTSERLHANNVELGVRFHF